MVLYHEVYKHKLVQLLRDRDNNNNNIIMLTNNSFNTDNKIRFLFIKLNILNNV